MEVIPAIIPKSYKDLEEKLRVVKDIVPLVQIDITDGEFVPGTSWPCINASAQDEFQSIVSGESGLPFWENLDFEADLMIESPESSIEDWVAAGFSRIIIHIESTHDFEGIVEKVAGRAEVGLALDIDTPNENVEKYLGMVDFVQCMGIAEIGSQGQPFDERVIPKIRHFKQMQPDGIISVDGGVNFESALLLRDADVDRVVSGSTVYEATDMGQAIERLGQTEL